MTRSLPPAGSGKTSRAWWGPPRLGDLPAEGLVKAPWGNSGLPLPPSTPAGNLLLRKTRSLQDARQPRKRLRDGTGHRGLHLSPRPEGPSPRTVRLPLSLHRTCTWRVLRVCGKHCSVSLSGPLRAPGTFTQTPGATGSAELGRHRSLAALPVRLPLPLPGAEEGCFRGSSCFK